MINVAIPTYNRRDSIEEFFLRNKWALNSSKFTIYILDNASTDDTAQFCEKLSAKYRNINVIKNKIHVSAQENVKRAYDLNISGHLWIIGDRYQISESDVMRLIDVVERNGEHLLLLSLSGSCSTTVNEEVTISHQDEIIFKKKYMLAASCLSTAVYPEFARKLASAELNGIDTAFPHTLAIIKTLLKYGEIKYLPGIKVASAPGKLNWAYTRNWIDTGFLEWFKLIDKTIPENHPKLKAAYRMFPTNTSLGSFRGAVKRRIMKIISFNDMQIQRHNLIKGLGILRYCVISLIAILPLDKIGRLLK